MTMSQYLEKSMHIILKYKGNYNPGQKGLGHFSYPLPFLVESWWVIVNIYCCQYGYA